MAGHFNNVRPYVICFLRKLCVFGLFLVLFEITYFYWNSSIGPAKNGGPDQLLLRLGRYSTWRLNRSTD